MDLQQAQHDYQRVAAAIAWMRAHHLEQPALGDIAAVAGLSESHFQRLFSRWAGVSPKRFLQYLTLGYAQRVMRESADVLSASLESGLSGPGRLHDLFVTLEAVSPGEYRRQADGLCVDYGEIATPFGRAAIGFTRRGVCHLSFLDAGADTAQRVREAWPAAHLRQDPAGAAALGRQIFAGADAASPRPVSAWVVGSNFQVQVWRALLRLPRGYLWSYAELAARAGSPRAARAAGTAMTVNPLAYLIPCHRVLRQGGEVGEYHWGEERKALMVAWEAAQRERTQ
jgi:AraC family transcriptional regulator, regulatory protein of adaptative response / methylated-DNA-[protein]-cysteine methyltransferase